MTEQPFTVEIPIEFLEAMARRTAELVLAELSVRAAHGGPPDPDELAGRFPHLLDRLAGVLAFYRKPDPAPLASVLPPRLAQTRQFTNRLYQLSSVVPPSARPSALLRIAWRCRHGPFRSPPV